MKWTIITIGVIISLSSCYHPEIKKTNIDDRTDLISESDKPHNEQDQILNDINNTLTSFFKSYTGDLGTVNKDLISEDLSDLISTAIALEKSDAIKVANSNEPTDKPMLIEGDIFSSLYEGADNFIIERIENVGNKAIVTVKLSNTTYKLKWVDEIVFIKQQRWVIDDVIFKGAKTELSSTKAFLKDFIAKH